MIDRMFNKGSLQTLVRVTQFTGARGRILSDNIANLSTPRFKARDLSVKDFQKTLRMAIGDRRRTHTPMSGRLNLRDTSELSFGESRMNKVSPSEINDGVLFHDENNRDLERTMQHLAENAMAHNTAIQLMRQEFSVMQSAIRERV